MATYNWSIRPGIKNIYGIVVLGTDNEDSPEVSGCVYIALFGNDKIGNGSRLRPFKTWEAAKAKGYNGYNVVFASGVYRGLSGISSAFADGDVTIDNSVIAPDNYIGDRLNGFKINSVVPVGFYTPSVNNFIELNGSNASISQGGNGFKGNLIKNGHQIYFEGGRELINVAGCGNNTIINCTKVIIGNGGEGLDGNYNKAAYFSLFSNCNIEFQEVPAYFDYAFFHNCRFKWATSSDDYAIINTLDDLLAFIYDLYPSYKGAKNCKFGDPKFNNPDIGDYSLAFDSPAKNVSYLGTYVGAKSIGYPIKAKAMEVDGGFDFSTNVNLTIADDSLTLTNPEIDASIESKVISNITGRELAEAPIFGFNADRNGQYIDSISDLSNALIGVGTDLEALTPYLVEGAAIVIDGAVIQPGERFTTNDVVTFTSDGGGVCREILEAPQKHTIMARFSNGGVSKSVGDALVAGNWYYPITGTINYNGIDYTEKAFRALDTNSFTTPDGGTLIEAFTNEAYQHYEPGIVFSSNNIGNVKTGAILRGNGDPDYIRGVGFEFPINARFIQLKYIIRVKNLKP